VGDAVERNRVKRQLREIWRERLDRVPDGNDYVLIVRPGLPEAVTANGFEWLGERVDEVLSQTKRRDSMGRSRALPIRGDHRATSPK
jgi:ribonuclease P protein component